MSKAEHNRQLITDFLGCWQRQDIDAAMKYYADDVVYIQAGHSKLAGTYHGTEDFFARWVKSVNEMTNNRWTVNAPPEIILAGDDGCVVIVDETMIRDGKGEINTKKLVVYTIRDDKLVTCRLYDGDQGAIDDFWS